MARAITATIGEIVRGQPDIFPPYLYEAYASTRRRAPLQPLVDIPLTISELTGPGPAISELTDEDADLTRNAGTGGEAIGERIIVTGRVLDANRGPIPNSLVEVWQPNAAGRYFHRNDQHHAPLDPNFIGMGRCKTNAEGVYRFVTIRPGAYPWLNHPNAWRPPHIHFSVFGAAFASRLITQMFFPGDPLLALDPIVKSIPTEAARERLIATYDHDVTESGWALGFRFDIVVSGVEATPFEGATGFGS
jgi:protocatechuate 3,4-dioxygenase beta subunit